MQNEIKLPLPPVQEDLLRVVSSTTNISATDLLDKINTSRKRHGVPILKVGSFYPTLHKIRDYGLIVLDNERNADKQRNKYYKVTEVGNRAIALMNDYRAELISHQPKP
jgi:DNA-binding PadR family transcriptional regulator